MKEKQAIRRATQYLRERDEARRVVKVLTTRVTELNQENAALRDDKKKLMAALQIVADVDKEAEMRGLASDQRSVFVKAEKGEEF